MAVFIGAELRALAQNFTPNYLYYIELKVDVIAVVGAFFPKMGPKQPKIGG